MKVLSDLFTLDSTTLDPRISTSLLTCVNSVVHGSELSLTAIGRNTGDREYDVYEELLISAFSALIEESFYE